MVASRVPGGPVQGIGFPASTQKPGLVEGRALGLVELVPALVSGGQVRASWAVRSAEKFPGVATHGRLAVGQDRDKGVKEQDLPGAPGGQR